MYQVAKTLYFNYGHRLLGGHDKCSHLHGHSAKVRIVLQARELDRQDRVVDFFDIKSTLGNWIECTLDHKMILNARDPLVKLLQKAGEPVVTVQGNPTAERLAEWIFKESRRMKLPVVEVSLWESEDSMAVYVANPKSREQNLKQ